jgi:hypothetical protein
MSALFIPALIAAAPEFAVTMSDAARRAGPSGPARAKEGTKVKFSPQAIEVADKVLDKPFSTEVWFRTGRDEKRTPSFRGK